MPKQTFGIQFKTIFNNVFLLAIRSKEIHVEIFFPLVTGCVMLIKNLLVGISFLTPIIIALAINGSTRSLLIRLVEEKNGRFKETQKIMGLKQTPYFLGWYLSCLLRTFMGGFLFLIIPLLAATKTVPEDFDITKPNALKQSQNFIGFWEIFYGEDVGKFILLYILYVFAAVHQSFALSTFFSSPKLAGEVGTFFTTMITLLVFLVYYNDFANSVVGFIILGIFPQACVAFGYVVSSKTFAFPQISVYTVDGAIAEMAVIALFYFVIYFYLDQVIPNEYGIAKHPLFCLKRSHYSDKINASKFRNSELLKQSDLKEQLLKQNQTQQFQDKVVDVSSAIFHEKYENAENRRCTVEIGRLSKYFGDLKAVNDVSINLYERNIFCLLGHNGCGKTTTISLLTGLISKSYGNVKIYDKDLEEDLEDIRNNLGICSQKDVLYDELTFEEQLIFMARIKGVPEEKLEVTLNEMLDKIKCQGERKKMVKALSGGNKRKLSLAMALIGGSQIVFLDEPSSGMDAISRRSIWEILEIVRNEDRTIVLTTHHLDEAEILADRIAIMAKGKLLAVGTSDFIKKNFGVGYHLKIFPNPELENYENFVITEEMKQNITKIVEEEIPEASLNPQSRKDTLLYQLPFSKESNTKFSNVFEKLEQIEGIMVNLEMNNLEDAFINIGMDEDKFFDKDHHVISFDNVRKSMGKSMIDGKQEAKFTKFDQIHKPRCLSNPPVYSFQQQFLACFLRKFYCTIRTFTNYVAFIIPIVLLIAGAIILQVISSDSDFSDDNKVIVYALFVALAYSFNGGIYIILPVQEREDNLKYALNVMGCRTLPYWAATFAFDMIVFSITIIVFICCVFIGQIQFLMSYASKMVLALMCFGLSYIPFSYMCGFMFKKANSAMKGFPLFNFFIVFNLPFVFIGIMALLYQNEYVSKDVWQGISGSLTILYFFSSPFYVMQWCIDVLPIETQQSTDDDVFYVISYEYWVYIGVLLAQSLFFFGVTYILEKRSYSVKQEDFKEEQLRQEYSSELKQIEDEVVQQEKIRVQETVKQNGEGFNPETPVIVNKLWKQYENGFVAIKDLSYQTQKGDIFGLLGPNGSGKSTSFNLLTSLIPKTLGSIKIKNLEVNKGVMKIYQDVGICPQFDCIWPNLNPVEHLYLFGRMKGLKGRDLDESVQYFIDIMQLRDFVNTKAGRLSGGNKRKLCVSDALIGGPDIQFFDEPSTGVDPIARRFLWNTLQQGAQLRNSSIIMTTHTMEEAESLCTKIGILINGQFYCIGSPADLRHKYGEGYTISIKMQEDSRNVEICKEKIQEIFPGTTELKDKKELFYNFRVRHQQFQFSKAFKICEQLQEEGVISDFSINQSSLEEVFVYFSKYQREDQKI